MRGQVSVLAGGKADAAAARAQPGPVRGSQEDSESSSEEDSDSEGAAPVPAQVRLGMAESSPVPALGAPFPNSLPLTPGKAPREDPPAQNCLSPHQGVPQKRGCLSTPWEDRTHSHPGGEAEGRLREQQPGGVRERGGSALSGEAGERGEQPCACPRGSVP